jgi:hypothetical protein
MGGRLGLFQRYWPENRDWDLLLQLGSWDWRWLLLEEKPRR